MTKTLVVLAAAVALAACTREVEYDSAGSIDTTRDTVARLNVPDIDVGMKRDTFTLPTVDLRKDTLIMGRKNTKSAVRRWTSTRSRNHRHRAYRGRG
jgi:hypothetical protein